LVAIDQSLPEALHIHAVKLIYRTRIVGHRQVTIHFDHNVSHLRLFTVTQDYTGEYSICKVLLVGVICGLRTYSESNIGVTSNSGFVVIQGRYNGANR